MGVINPLDPDRRDGGRSGRPRDAQIHPEGVAGRDRGLASRAPLAGDIKPKHGSPDFARDVAMQKIQAAWRAERLASEELGRLADG